MRSKERIIIILLIIFIIFLGGFIVVSIHPFFISNIKYNIADSFEKVPVREINSRNDIINTPQSPQKPTIPIPVTHMATPKIVKAVYLTSWVAGEPKLADPIFDLVKKTELNTVVIDIKDSSGRIAFDIPNKEIEQLGSVQHRIRNIRSLINGLHKNGVYVIGRISSFQDPFIVKISPSWDLKKISDGAVWKNSKGLAFLDPTKEGVKQYILDIALGAYNQGFDEINFDYVRYPSDGDVEDIDYGLKPGETKADNIESFFKFIHEGMKKDKNIPISVDLFGMTTEVTDDMGIGQDWERSIPYFDYICPMLYPSHYSTGHLGFEKPSEHPYKIISNSLSKAITRTKVMNENINKIRPWLQDFDLGAVYDKAMVDAEIKAVNDTGLSSWMLWNPKSKYDKGDLKLENNN